MTTLRRSSIWLLTLTLIGLACAYAWPGFSTPARAGNSQQLLVFTLQAPPVSADQTSTLARQFTAIAPANSTPQTDTNQYKGRSRYITPDSTYTAFLERYSATGGFYAYNPGLAFSETGLGALNETTAAQRACGFLFKGPNSPSRNFVGPDGELLAGHDTGQTPTMQTSYVRTSAPGDCSSPGYKTSLIYSAVEDAGSTTPAAPQAIGALVQVPLFVSGFVNPTNGTGQIPLGGAGGHLSFLVNGGNRFQTLDVGSPGMSAVSMPFYSREVGVLERNGVPAGFTPRDPAQVHNQVEQAVRSSYPTATDVIVPNPTIFYDVSDAGTPQTIMEPKYSFSGIQLTVDGNTIILKDVTVPAIDSGPGGLGPVVTISAPAAGTAFTPGSMVTFSGSVANGAGPYSYTWQLEDGTVLGTGDLAAAGPITLQTSNLPAVSHAGTPAPVTVYLYVTDSEGVQRSAAVQLRPAVAPYLYLPLVLNGNAASSAQIALPIELQASARTSGSGIYDFGIEANSDYPPFGVSQPGDLPGVVPDANGFSSSMQSFGWGRKFNWWNASAWERDWRDCGLGGSDCTYGVDRTDFAYYSGHGGAGGLALATNINSTWFDGANARYSTLRWAGFSSCQTLRAQWPTPGQEPIRRWFGAFRGAHMLLGFNSNMADIAYGAPLADRMKPITFFGITLYQMTIREAWVMTAFTLNAGKPAYIYAVGTNGVNPVNNKLPRATDGALPRPYPVASYHWVWWNE